jgi:hypothetical protein
MTMLGRFDSGRPLVDSGPFKPKNGLKLTGTTVAIPVCAVNKIGLGGYELTKENSLSVLPQRMWTRKSRTSLAAPSNFDESLLARSALLPDYACTR